MHLSPGIYSDENSRAHPLEHPPELPFSWPNSPQHFPLIGLFLFILFIGQTSTGTLSIWRIFIRSSTETGAASVIVAIADVEDVLATFFSSFSIALYNDFFNKNFRN